MDTGLQQEELISMILMYNLQGVIATDEDTTLMKKALQLVSEGQIWIDNKNLKALLSKAGNMSRTGKIDGISKREKDVLEQITQGKKNKEIAAHLFMSEQTVKAHISHIFKKFHVSSRSQLLSQLMTSSHEII
jgi:DNA-binding NarL/FixJ family response regulator